MTTAISQIRRRIVEAMQRGGDTSELEGQLKRERQEETLRAEVAELKAIADRRKGWEARAEAVTGKVQAQGEAVDRFLDARDGALKELDKIIELAAAMQSLQDDANARYSRPQQFRDEASGIPEGYLPANLTCAFLMHDKISGEELAACRSIALPPLPHVPEAHASVLATQHT